jgi:hypothetical protein
MTTRPPATEQDAREATVRGAVLGHHGLMLTAAGLIVSVLGIYLGVAATRSYYPFESSAKAVTPPCTQTIEEASDGSTRLRPPANVAIHWSESQTQPGRVSAVIHWVNKDSRTAFGLIQVAGRYGAQSPDDEPIRTDSRELPAAGLCGTWYRQWRSPDDGERGVFIDGLWPNESYCFAVNVSDKGGGVQAPFPSIATKVCEESPWRSAWGRPDTP